MNALQILQQQCGVEPDGVFGPMTIKAAAPKLQLSRNQAVNFFAQCAHETALFTQFEENINYSADALLKVFPKYFKDAAQAKAYAKNPQKIANRVYANRMGNGDELSGDGWRYRGRGAIQLTGKANYDAFFKHVGKTGQWLANDVSTLHAFTSAMFFFEKNNLWSVAEQTPNADTATKLCKAINGGYNGLPDRIELTEKYAQWL